MSTEFDIVCKSRVDKKHGVIHGWAMVSKVKDEPYVDFHGDWIPEDSMYEAGLEFAEKHRAMKVQHAGQVAGSVPFIMPLDGSTKEAYGLTGEYAGLAVGLRPADKSLVDQVGAGLKYTGLSIGGKRVKDRIVDRETGKSLGEIDVGKLRACLMNKGLIDDGLIAALDGEYEEALDSIAKAAKLQRNKLRRIMEKFELHEISPVDVPAQEPALARLNKSMKGPPIVTLDEKVAFSEPVVQVDRTPDPRPRTEQTMDKDKIIADLTAENSALKAKLDETAKAAVATKTDLDAAKSKLDAVEKRFDAVLRLDLAKDVSHVAWLKTDAERDAFLAKGREARDEVIKAVTVYQGKDGTIYRPGQEDTARLAKRLDAQDEQLAKSAAEVADATIAKAAGDMLGKAPGVVDVKVSVLKAVRGIADEKVRKEAEAWLGVVGKAYGSLLKGVGVAGASSLTGAEADAALTQPDSAMVKLNAIAKSLRDANKDLGEDEAFAQACDQHPELYEAASSN